MAVGFPAKTTYVNGDVFSASDINDTNGTLNLINPATKGSIVSASAANTPAILTVGNNGETLIADSSTSIGLRYNPQNALINPVINGAFDCWQRGTSNTITFGGGFLYNADRFWSSTGFNGVISRQPTGDTTNVPNIQYCARVQRNLGDTNTGTGVFCSPLETSTTIPYVGKTVTVSFYARRGANFSAPSNILGFNLITGTGTDQSRFSAYPGEAYPIFGDSTLTTTWQRFAYTGTISSTVTEMAVYFRADRTGTAGANDWFEITGIQIDLGTYTASTAPTFHRSGGTIQGELSACQRYYQFIGGTNGAYPGDQGYLFGGGSSATPLPFPVQMRIAPAITKNGTWFVSNCGQPFAGYINNQGFSMSVTSSSTGGYIVYPNSTDDTFTMNAEL